MKIILSTDKTSSDEVCLFLTDLFRKILKKEMKNLNIIEKNKKLRDLLSKKGFNFIMPKESELQEDYLLFNIESECTNLYLNSVLKAARNQNLHFISLFILLFCRNINLHPFGEVHVIEKEDLPFVIREIKKAFELGLISKNKERKVFDFLSGEENIEKHPLLSFIEDLEKNLNEHSFLSIEDTDYHIEASHRYKDVIGINYKEILYSDEFKSYVDNNEISNDDFEDLPFLINTYFEETNDISFFDCIIEEIRKDPKKYNRHLINEYLIKEIMFGNTDETIFDHM